MAVIETWFEQDLQKAVQVQHLDGSLFSNNANGNRIGVVVYNNGVAASLSGTVSGYAVLPDGTTVPCTGSLSGNRASVLIPAAAYQPGIIFVSVFLTSGSTVTTLAAVAANVQQARTDSQVSPGSAVTDWTQTINAAMQSVVTANAANMAVEYGSLTYPVPVGKYTIYNDLLYRCTTPIATAESWTASHWTRVRIADEVSDLKSALNSYASGETRTQSGISANQNYIFDGYYFKGQTITITNSTSGTITVNIWETNGTEHEITQNLAKDKSISFVVAYDLCDRIRGYCAGAGSVTIVVDSPIDALNKTEQSLLNKIAIVQAEIPKQKPTETYANKGLSPGSGVLRNDNGFTTFEYYVYGIGSITITPNFSNGAYGYAFYKEDGSFISASGDVYRQAGTAINIPVPTSAYYVKFSSKDSEPKPVTIDSDWGAIIATKDIIKPMETRITQIENDSSIDIDLNVSWSQMNIAGDTGYINTSGNVVAYENQYVSELIPINSANSISYKVAYIYAIAIAIAFYNKNGTFISGITAQSGTSGSFTVVTGTSTPPENAAYIRYSMSKNSVGGIYNNDQYVRFTEKQTVKNTVEELMESGGANPWVNKKWCAFGTSITDTSYINQETGEPTGKYVPFLAQYSGLQVTNRGIAGGTIGSGGIHGGSSSILNAILNSNDLDTFDLITLEGFVNDFAAAVSIGEIGDTANTTMYGALHQALSYILANSHAEIILITETTGKVYTPSGGTQVSYNILRKNSLNLYQQDYNDVIIRIGQFYGVHVIDAGGKSQINQYHPEYIIDQIHHTTLGGEQYAKTIWEELRNITPAKTSN